MTNAELIKEIDALYEKATKGPWRECGHDRGGCQCCKIWSEAADAPVAETTHGKWGDDYPSLRFVEGTGGEGSLGPQIEAYIDQITYGEVPVEQGMINAALIVALVNAWPQIRALLSAPEPSALEIAERVRSLAETCFDKASIGDGHTVTSYEYAIYRALDLPAVLSGMKV